MGPVHRSRCLKYPQNSWEQCSVLQMRKLRHRLFSALSTQGKTKCWDEDCRKHPGHPFFARCPVIHSWVTVIGPGKPVEEGKWKSQSKAPFSPDIAFILRLGIILPFISEGLVHIYPLLVFRFRVCLIFNSQIDVFSIVYKYCSIRHRDDINESFI